MAAWARDCGEQLGLSYADGTGWPLSCEGKTGGQGILFSTRVSTVLPLPWVGEEGGWGEVGKQNLGSGPRLVRRLLGLGKEDEWRVWSLGQMSGIEIKMWGY